MKLLSIKVLFYNQNKKYIYKKKNIYIYIYNKRS